MHSRSDGPVRDLQRGCDLRRVQSEIVTKGEDRPLVRRQAPERAIQLVAVEDRLGVVERRSLVEGDGADVGGSPPPAPRLGIAFVDQETGQPRVEPFRIAESWQLTP